MRMLLDEFANIGQIPQFEKLIATIRSREISASIILQSKSQLKAIYKDNADTIEGNCDTTLFRTKENKDQKTSIVEMCITGYGIPLIPIYKNTIRIQYLNLEIFIGRKNTCVRTHIDV